MNKTTIFAQDAAAIGIELMEHFYDDELFYTINIVFHDGKNPEKEQIAHIIGECTYECKHCAIMAAQEIGNILGIEQWYQTVLVFDAECYEVVYEIDLSTFNAVYSDETFYNLTADDVEDFLISSHGIATIHIDGMPYGIQTVEHFFEENSIKACTYCDSLTLLNARNHIAELIGSVIDECADDMCTSMDGKDAWISFGDDLVLCVVPL